MIDGARWRGPLPASNYSTAPLGPPRTLVVHHIDGTLASADALFHTPGVQRSAHAGTGRDGTLYQWVDEAMTAYAQCAGNWGIGAVSVENDDGGADLPPTDAQLITLGHVGRALGIVGIPATSPTSGGVAYHHQFGGPCETAWGQTDCPGRFVEYIDAICDAINHGAPPTPPAPPEGDSMVFVAAPDPAGHSRAWAISGGIAVCEYLGPPIPVGIGNLTLPADAAREINKGVQFVQEATGQSVALDSLVTRTMKANA